MLTEIRLFQEEDIPYKVKWINDEKNNQYLHYDLPLLEDKTLIWFKSLDGRKDRVDYTITYDNKPVGIIGLLNIDLNKKEAEYYICLGEHELKGKGVAKDATELLIKEAYSKFSLKSIYLYTEVENLRAQKFFEKCGFKKIGLLQDNLFYNGKFIDRFLYELNLNTFMNSSGE